MEADVRGDLVRIAPRLAGRVVGAALRTAPLIAVVVLFVDGSGLGHPWLAVLLVLLLLPGPVLRWLVVLTVARRPWAVELDAQGVRWWGSASPLPWSDLERVEVHVARGARRLLPNAGRLLFVTPVEAAFADRSGTAPTSRAIRLSEVRARAADVVGAVRRFSDVPVHGDRPDGQPWRRATSGTRRGRTNA